MKIKHVIISVLLLFLCVPVQGQIRNRLDVNTEVYLKYANGSIRQFDESNLILADSIYQFGVYKNDSRYKMLALSLELPARFMQRDSLRMENIVAELKSMAGYNRQMTEFYFMTMYDWCNLLMMSGRVSDAMLEARDMSSRATKARSSLGQMYAHRVIGLIQSYRTNSELAVRNFIKAADYCVQAREEQELPGIYIMIARELIKLKRFDQAVQYCSMAEEFQDFYPSLKVQVQMTKAYLFEAEGDMEAFRNSYIELNKNPLYHVQTDLDTRRLMEICWLRSSGLYSKAIQLADSLSKERDMFEQKSELYALDGKFHRAYDNLNGLMATKDSIYIAVQNEDMAILDAELNNAQLRLEAQRLKSQQEIYIMFGFVFVFLLVTLAIMFSYSNLNMTLDNLRERNRTELEQRNAFRKAIDAKELENEVRTRIMQNRNNNNPTI